VLIEKLHDMGNDFVLFSNKRIVVLNGFTILPKQKRAEKKQANKQKLATDFLGWKNGVGEDRCFDYKNIHINISV
jgi:hypothetical protein